MLLCKTHFSAFLLPFWLSLARRLSLQQLPSSTDKFDFWCPSRVLPCWSGTYQLDWDWECPRCSDWRHLRAHCCERYQRENVCASVADSSALCHLICEIGETNCGLKVLILQDLMTLLPLSWHLCHIEIQIRVTSLREPTSLLLWYFVMDFELETAKSDYPRQIGYLPFDPMLECLAFRSSTWKCCCLLSLSHQQKSPPSEYSMNVRLHPTEEPKYQDLLFPISPFLDYCNQGLDVLGASSIFSSSDSQRSRPFCWFCV